jgi:hypothetical protein
MSIRFIPTSIHGALDYSASVANLAFPKLFRLEDTTRAARWVQATSSACEGASYWLPHLLMGMADMPAAATSKAS